MKLGVALSFIDVAVSGDLAAIRELAQTAEEIGYQDFAAPDQCPRRQCREVPRPSLRHSSSGNGTDPCLRGVFLWPLQDEFSVSLRVSAKGRQRIAHQRAALLSAAENRNVPGGFFLRSFDGNARAS